MIKAIFFDIDGTLQTLGLGNDTYVPDSTKRALKELRKKGIKIMIASGRPINILPIIEAKCEIQFDGYVMMNGQYCFTPNEIVRQKTIPVDELEKAIHFLIEKDIPCTIAEEEKVYQIEEIKSKKEQYYKDVYSYKRIYENPVYQIMPVINSKDVEIEKEFFSLMPSCKSARWIYTFIDVIPSDGGKNTGIDAMIKHFNISLDETMSFGDGGNDVAMLDHTAVGVVMGNANDDVKEHGNYVTDHIEKDGLAKALIHFGILDNNILI